MVSREGTEDSETGAAGSMGTLILSKPELVMDGRPGYCDSGGRKESDMSE